MWWFGHHGLGYGGMMFGGVMMLLFWGGLILLGWLLIRNVFSSGRRSGVQQDNPPKGSPPTNTALEILKERYARGEITKAEFEEIRRDIIET